MCCHHRRRQGEGSLTIYRSRSVNTNPLSERCLNSSRWNNSENTNTLGALHHGSPMVALKDNYSPTVLPSVACRWTPHSHDNSEVGS